MRFGLFLILLLMVFSSDGASSSSSGSPTRDDDDEGPPEISDRPAESSPTSRRRFPDPRRLVPNPRNLPNPRHSLPNPRNVGRSLQRGMRSAASTAVNFVRHNRCERYRPRYEQAILEILTRVVPNVAIQCECHSRHWMMCQVSTNPGENETTLRRRLDPDQPDHQLRPFYVIDFSLFLGGIIPIRPMVFYTRGRCRVMAEVVVIRQNERITVAQRFAYLQEQQEDAREEPTPAAIQLPPAPADPSFYLQTPPELMYIITETQNIVERLNLEVGPSLSLEDQQDGRKEDSDRKQRTLRRASSAPAAVSAAFHPENFMPIHLCQDDHGKATCPIMLTDFAPFNVVYILKQDVERVENGQPVICISSEGLMSLSRTPESKRDYGFVDPFRRTGEQFLTVQDDFVAYILVEGPEFCSDSDESPRASPFVPATAGSPIPPDAQGIPGSSLMHSSQAASTSQHEEESPDSSPPKLKEERISLSKFHRTASLLFIFLTLTLLYFYIIFTFYPYQHKDQYNMIEEPI